MTYAVVRIGGKFRALKSTSVLCRHRKAAATRPTFAEADRIAQTLNNRPSEEAIDATVAKLLPLVTTPPSAEGA